MKEKRTLTDKLSRELAREYSNYQQVLANILRPFARLKASPSDIRGTKFKVHEIVRRLNVTAMVWAKMAIREAYKSKRAEVAPIAKAASVFSTGKGTDRSKESIDRLIKRAGKDLIDANNSIERTVYTFLSAYEKAVGGVDSARSKTETQFMAGGMEAEISRKVDYYLARGYDSGSISRKLRKYLETLVDGKDLIEINGRFYGLKAFAENMARSELHNAYVEATIDECKQYDCDLVQFSRHDEPCELCSPLEGMVFSISGTDADFPSLNEKVSVETEKGTVEVDPKFVHHRCEHGLNPVTRNILRAAGEL